MYQRPIYMRLREHHFLDDGSISSCVTEPDPDGLLRAWFPKDSVLSEDRVRSSYCFHRHRPNNASTTSQERSHVEVYQPASQSRRRYETYCPTQNGVGVYPGLVASKSKQKVRVNSLMQWRY